MMTKEGWQNNLQQKFLIVLPEIVLPFNKLQE